MKVSQVKKIPKWLRRGIGANGGGDYIGKQDVNGVEREIYLSWKGINTCSVCSAYFKDETGQWFKIRSEDITI